MNQKEKINLARELRENMDLTKEQYLELCRMVDELGLERPEIDPEDMDWDDLLEQIDN